MSPSFISHYTNTVYNSLMNIFNAFFVRAYFQLSLHGLCPLCSVAVPLSLCGFVSLFLVTAWNNTQELLL
jgi:hypothetical protein